MKDLIAISSYCPTTEKKQALMGLITKLQELRDSFDILIVSHSPIDIILMEMVDFVHYDRNNELLTDFDLTNGFFYSNDKFFINSSLVYPFSTHLACFSLLYDSINFAKFRNYKKFHWMEYDFLPENTDIIYKSSEILNECDNFMIQNLTNSWVHGSYLAFKIDNLEFGSGGLDLKDKILKELKSHPSNHSEHVIETFLSRDNRSTYYYDLNSLILINGKDTSIDSHTITPLNWVVPVYNTINNNVDIFIYNEKGGKYNITVIINDKVVKYDCPPKLGWSLSNIINNIEDGYLITVYINNEITKEIIINKDNLKDFKKYNNIQPK